MTRRWVPVGEFTPLRRHRFVDAAAVIAAFRGAPSMDYDLFRADLDAIVSQDIEPRG